MGYSNRRGVNQRDEQFRNSVAHRCNSVTSPMCSSYSSTNKKRKMYPVTTAEFPPRKKPKGKNFEDINSPFLNLPDELIQRIFLESMEVNFALASPLLGRLFSSPWLLSRFAERASWMGLAGFKRMLNARFCTPAWFNRRRTYWLEWLVARRGELLNQLAAGLLEIEGGWRCLILRHMADESAIALDPTISELQQTLGLTVLDARKELLKSVVILHDNLGQNNPPDLRSCYLAPPNLFRDSEWTPAVYKMWYTLEVIHEGLGLSSHCYSFPGFFPTGPNACLTQWTNEAVLAAIARGDAIALASLLVPACGRPFVFEDDHCNSDSTARNELGNSEEFEFHQEKRNFPLCTTARPGAEIPYFSMPLSILRAAVITHGCDLFMIRILLVAQIMLSPFHSKKSMADWTRDVPLYQWAEDNGEKGRVLLKMFETINRLSNDNGDGNGNYSVRSLIWNKIFSQEKLPTPPSSWPSDRFNKFWLCYTATFAMHIQSCAL